METYEAFQVTGLVIIDKNNKAVNIRVLFRCTDAKMNVDATLI